jgi:hypothetical protein
MRDAPRATLFMHQDYRVQEVDSMCASAHFFGTTGSLANRRPSSETARKFAKTNGLWDFPKIQCVRYRTFLCYSATLTETFGLRFLLGKLRRCHMKLETTDHAIHRVEHEIQCLTEEQTEAMETATFIGLTADETEQYDTRRARIVELVRELRLLQAAA